MFAFHAKDLGKVFLDLFLAVNFVQIFLYLDKIYNGFKHDSTVYFIGFLVPYLENIR